MLNPMQNSQNTSFQQGKTINQEKKKKEGLLFCQGLKVSFDKKWFFFLRLINRLWIDFR